MTDKYSALCVSHSSISAFLECPRSYYLKNVYRDPQTHHKIKIASPPLSLGQAVHEVIESLSAIKTNIRFNKSLLDRFEDSWKKVSGKKGGFLDESTESQYKQRGQLMINRVQKNPGPLGELSIKINQELPHYWLSEKDNIILCGKIDWLRYSPDTNTVDIIDFKTSRYEEGKESLQLPIYHLLVKNCQHREVNMAYYWYLENNDELTPKELPDLVESEAKIMKIAKRIKLQRSLEKFDCPVGEAGCRYCLPYERILKGEGEFVGNDEFGADIYILDKTNKNEEDSKIF